MWNPLTILTFIWLFLISNSAHAQSGVVQLEHYNPLPGSPGFCGGGWCRDNFDVCLAKPKNFRIQFIYTGGHISGTCNANNPNNFRFKINFYRDGQQLVATSSANGTSGFYPAPGLTNILAVPGQYSATATFEKRLCKFGQPWQVVNTWTSNKINVGKQAATPNFTINGVAASDDTNVPTLSLNNGDPILLDASSTKCASAYNIWVSETGINWWERTYNYEWERWFNGPPGSAINLQYLATDSANYGSFTGLPSRKGQILFGGNIYGISIAPGQSVLQPYQQGLLGQQRRYTVQVATNEPTWKTKKIQVVIN
ncbi:MAG: hypothetical protein E6Q50_14270 [Lysobacter sp.]|nr:MAG: hypothetical protein E6Q50_14270 [Lysobacter sp.]